MPTSTNLTTPESVIELFDSLYPCNPRSDTAAAHKIMLSGLDLGEEEGLTQEKLEEFRQAVLDNWLLVSTAADLVEEKGGKISIAAKLFRN